MIKQFRDWRERRALARLIGIRTGIELSRGVYEGRYDRFGTAYAVMQANNAIRAGFLHQNAQHGGICPVHAVPRVQARIEQHRRERETAGV